MAEFIASPTMEEFMLSPKYVRVLAGPIGCLRGDTLVATEEGLLPIADIDRPIRVLSWNARTGRYQLSPSGGAFPKGKDYLYRVQTPSGEFVGAGHHRVLCEDGTYCEVRSLVPGQSVLQHSPDPVKTTSDLCRSSSRADDPRWNRIDVGFLGHCAASARQYGQRLLQAVSTAPGLTPAPADAQGFSQCAAPATYAHTGDHPAQTPARNHHDLLGVLRQKTGSCLLEAPRRQGEACRVASSGGGHTAATTRGRRQSHETNELRQPAPEHVSQKHSLDSPDIDIRTSADRTILAVERLSVKEVYWDLQVADTNNYVTADGTVHHNSGKSVCCAHELMRWACDQKPNADGIRKTRFLIVRNTADQLKSTTLKTILDWFPPEVYGRFSRTDRTLHYTLRLADDTIVQTEWMLIALDTPDDVRKALSLEATGLWGNESRELHPEVVDGLIMRVNRYPSAKDGGITRAGAIFDTNYPDEDTWWEDKMVNPPRNWSTHEQPPAVLPLDAWIEKYQKDPAEDQVGMSIEEKWYAVDPAADNWDNLSRDYWPQTVEGKTEDFIRVYLRCQFGRSMGGLPVYDKTYKVDRHENQGEPLKHIHSEQYPLCIGLDFGRTPAAIICQLTPRGTISVLSEVIGENMGIQTFVRKHLKPHLVERYAGMPSFIAADPAGWAKSQNDELSPVDVLEKEGFKVLKPPTNKPSMRIEAVEQILQESSDTEPRLKINRECHMLIQGFRGKYRWKTDRKGDLMNTKEPEKNEYSHVHDAFQYSCMLIDGSGLGARLNSRRVRREVKRASAAGWT